MQIRNRFRIPLAALVVAGLTGSIGLLAGFNDRHRVQSVPRVWTDAAMHDWELPLADASRSPRPVSEDYYYKLPERVVYRTYPVYHPDYEPPGYRQWLEQQEPEIVLDESKLVTQADYIKAGALLFDYPIDTLGAIISAEDVRDPAFYAYSGMQITKEGILPFARWVVPEKGKVYLGNLSCGMCHTRVMPDGQVVQGAQGNWPGDKAFTYSLRNAPEEAIRGVTRVLFGSPWTPHDVHGKLINGPIQQIIDAYNAVPSGAFGRQGTSILYPPQVPDLIGVKNRRYLDHGGLAQHRGIEDMMRYIAMNQALDFMNLYGDYHPLGLSEQRREVVPPPQFPGTYSRHSDKQLYALASFVYSLTLPANPNKPSALSERGKRIFAEQGCVTCHTPPLFTNNMLTPANGFTIPEEHYNKYDLFDISVGTDPGYTLHTRRGTGYYKVPSLLGVWYRGPFFHDASLASLEDVLDPARLRDDYVPTGFKGAGVTHRPVKGHVFGMDLNANDKRALIAYLKTL